MLTSLHYYYYAVFLKSWYKAVFLKTGSVYLTCYI